AGHGWARCPPGSTWRRSSTAPVLGLRAGPVDAALAGNPLPAGRHLGRRRHQLRGVLRGRRGGGAVPVRRSRRRPARGDQGRADRGGRVLLARPPPPPRPRPPPTPPRPTPPPPP